MATVTTVEIATFFPELVRHEVTDIAYRAGGCPSRCHFYARCEYDVLECQWVIKVRHNGRETYRFTMARMIESGQDRSRSYEQLVSWLRGLHRFPAESGIK
jgi:hypothetical protein